MTRSILERPVHQRCLVIREAQPCLRRPRMDRHRFAFVFETRGSPTVEWVSAATTSTIHGGRNASQPEWPLATEKDGAGGHRLLAQDRGRRDGARSRACWAARSTSPHQLNLQRLRVSEVTMSRSPLPRHATALLHLFNAPTDQFTTAEAEFILRSTTRHRVPGHRRGLNVDGTTS